MHKFYLHCNKVLTFRHMDFVKICVYVATLMANIHTYFYCALLSIQVHDEINLHNSYSEVGVGDYACVTSHRTLT